VLVLVLVVVPGFELVLVHVRGVVRCQDIADTCRTGACPGKSSESWGRSWSSSRRRCCR